MIFRFGSFFFSVSYDFFPSFFSLGSREGARVIYIFFAPSSLPFFLSLVKDSSIFLDCLVVLDTICFLLKKSTYGIFLFQWFLKISKLWRLTREEIVMNKAKGLQRTEEFD